MTAPLDPPPGTADEALEPDAATAAAPRSGNEGADAGQPDTAAAADPGHPESAPGGASPPGPGQGAADGAAAAGQPDTAAADIASPAEAVEQDGATVTVIEDGVLSARLRRPLDLARMMLGILLAALILSFVWLAANTTAELDQDLLTASRRLPDLLVLVLNAVAGLGLLTLPVAVGIDLLIRHRGRQLFDAVVGLFAAATVLTLGSILVEGWAPNWLQMALTGSASPSDDAFLPLFGGLVAFITVARTLARQHWSAITVVVVASLMFVSFISGGLTMAGILLSLVVGWVVGLAVRYVLGTPTTRPPGGMVAQTLVKAGFGIHTMRAQESTEFGRRYHAELADGSALHVVVLDRDLEGAGLASGLWRSLRLRTSLNEATVNMRRTLDQRALLSYAGEVGDVPAPPLVLASEVGPDSALLAYGWLDGVRLSEIPPENVSDEDLRSAFRTLASLQSQRIAHRGLSAGNLLRQPDGTIALLSLSGGIVAASDVASRIDTAELLATEAIIAGPERAVAAGEAVLGPEELGRALPVLQKVALSQATRRALREHKGLLNALRDSLIERRPDGALEQIQLERVRPRTIITIILGSVAGYVLLSQLASVDLQALFRQANWGWAAFALLCSAITYVAAALTLMGFVPERLRLIPTIGAQLAASFATLITPPTLGAVAINLRFLQRQGVHPALATASIGASQATAFVVHILLLVGFAVAAGTQSDLTFQPPRTVVVAIAAGFAVSLGLLGIPPIRTWLRRRIGPLLRQIGPRLLTVVQQPRKMAQGLGGLFVLNVAYVAALAGCVYAFGGNLNVAAIAIVYLTGSVVGQAAPTPGGLGAVEAAMAAGLTAAGLNGGVAVSAVLLFRLVTFWLPTIPGWVSLNTMQRRGML